MSGVDLLEMEASQMMDVLHFQFEEYFTFYGEEHLGSANGIRNSIWTNLYGTKFKYEIKASKRPSSNASASYTDSYGSYSDDDLSGLGSVDPFSPRDRSENGEEIKPYIPPTDFNPDATNPFPGLDGPLG